jgi:hypothetical protein
VREHKTPFEIHVYEYEELPPGGFTLEGHFNFVGIGTNSFDGLVALTNHQFHMAGELTGGITDNVSLGFMLLSAVRPGGPGLEYACWRVLPHFYAPKSWHLPLELGLVGEFSFQRTKNGLFGRDNLTQLCQNKTAFQSTKSPSGRTGRPSVVSPGCRFVRLLPTIHPG